ncbi:ABC-2 transporter permease [Saccharopolyspora elongata]|uniref:hypothetical protein n=1 Tax=Saccharopolyspora elongata TaxID=2530387 RepID=UPI001F1C6189|nr:hypothetical protein [Saccharopolyspora elongata]
MAATEVRCGWWRAFRELPFFPATVLVFILAAAAALFAGSYTFAMANPTPHSVPLAVVGTRHDPALVAEMEEAAGTAFELHRYDYADALRAVEEQRVFGVLDLRGDVLRLVEAWLILALTMFSSGMVFTMFNALLGRWAMVPAWGLMVLLGNPSSGGAVSWPLLPSPLGLIGVWLPPGASVNAMHTAVYFGG